MRKTAKAMALLTAASMIMTAFTPVYAESTDDTAAVDWEKGDNIKAIKEKGVITVATGTYVPFEYRDDDNNIVGFDIDLAQYIADKLGVDMEVTDMEFQSIVPSIQNGEYDFSIAAMYKTDERCEVVDMSKSYCDSGMILAVKEDSEYADTIKSLADCDGLKVAVKEGATSYNVAQSFLDENPDVSYEIVQYKDTVGCVSDLLAGRVDVVVNDLLNQKILSQEYEGTKIVCDPFTHAENAIAVQKGKDDLLAFINECIDDYYADGTYDALWTKWIDASGDGEEAASAADAAVIVVSGKAGVQVGTQKAGELCEKYNLPRMIFVTEMDQDDVSYREVVEQLTELYGKRIAPLHMPLRENGKFVGYINIVKNKGRRYIEKDKKEEEEPKKEVVAEKKNAEVVIPDLEEMDEKVPVGVTNSNMVSLDDFEADDAPVLPQDDEYDLQKELEAKFDELFGPIDDDN